MRGREDSFSVPRTAAGEEQIPTGPKLPSFLGGIPTALPGSFPFQPCLSSAEAAA